MRAELNSMMIRNRSREWEAEELSLEVRDDQQLIAKPVVPDEEFTEFCYRIQDSVQYDYALLVKWWHPAAGHQLGRIRTMWGWIKQIDCIYDRVNLINDEESLWIEIPGIIEARKMLGNQLQSHRR